MKVLFTKTNLILIASCALTVVAFTFKDVPQQSVALAIAPLPPSTTQEVIDAANAFKATLTTAQIATVYLDYSFANRLRF